MLTWIDYVIAAVFVISVLVSLSRGFTREALSVLSWILAGWIALTFTGRLEGIIAPFVSSPAPRLAIAFVVLFVATLLVTGLLTYVVSLVMERRRPSILDRLLAMVFGAARAGLVITALVILSGLTTLPRDSAWQDAAFLPHFENFAQGVRGLLPDGVSGTFPH